MYDYDYNRVTITKDDVLRFFVENYIPWEIHNSIEFSNVTVTPPKTQVYAKSVIRWKSTFSKKNIHDWLYHNAYISSWFIPKFFLASDYNRKFRCHLVMAVPCNLNGHLIVEILTLDSSKSEYNDPLPPPSLDSDLDDRSD